MTQTEALITLLKRLPEIEMAEVLTEINAHLYTQKWNHLKRECLSTDSAEDKIRDLESDLEEMEEAKDQLVDNIHAALSRCDEYQDGDDVDDFIQSIKSDLQ